MPNIFATSTPTLLPTEEVTNEDHCQWLRYIITPHITHNFNYHAPSFFWRKSNANMHTYAKLGHFSFLHHFPSCLLLKTLKSLHDNDISWVPPWYIIFLLHHQSFLLLNMLLSYPNPSPNLINPIILCDLAITMSGFTRMMKPKPMFAVLLFMIPLFNFFC